MSMPGEQGALAPDLALYADEILQAAQELDLYQSAQFQARMTFAKGSEPHLELEYGVRFQEDMVDDDVSVGSAEASGHLQVFSEQLVVPMMKCYATQIIEFATTDAMQRPEWFREHSPQYDQTADGNAFTGGQLALEAYFLSTSDGYMALNVQAARLADGELYSQSVNFVEGDSELRRLTQISQKGNRPLHVLADIVPNIDNTLADITRYFIVEYDDLESATRLASVAKGDLGALTAEQLTALRADFKQRYNTDATVQTHVARAIELYEAEQHRIANQFSNPDDYLIDWDTLARCHNAIKQLNAG